MKKHVLFACLLVSFLFLQLSINAEEKAQGNYYWSYATKIPIMKNITFTNDRFIGFNTGEIFYSADSENWVKEKIAGLDGSKIYSDGEQYFILNNNKIWRSNDAHTWQYREVSGDMISMVYGKSMYVAVGKNGAINFSNDSWNWTSKKQGNVSLNGVTWTGKEFVAVGDNGLIITSKDGQIWTTQNSGVTSKLNDVCWNGTTLIAVGDNNVIITSNADGVAWSKQTFSDASTHNFGRIIWGIDKFYVLGSKKIIISTDGITWSTNSTSLSDGLTDIATNGKKILALDYKFAALYESDDGISWKDKLEGKKAYFNDTIYTGERFICVGKRIATSLDSYSWVYNSENYDNENFRGVAWGKEINKFVTVGEKGSIYSSDKEGKIWTKQNSGATTTLLSALWNGKKFIVSGEGGIILSSSDGEVWNKENSGINNDIFEIAWNGNVLIAVCSNGIIISSNDAGKSWSKQNSGTNETIKSIVWCDFPGFSQFIAVGPNVGVSSKDGAVWGKNGIPNGRKIKYVNTLLWILNGKSVKTCAIPKADAEWVNGNFEIDSDLLSFASTDLRYSIVVDGLRPVLITFFPPLPIKSGGNSIIAEGLNTGEEVKLIDNKLNFLSYKVPAGVNRYEFTNLSQNKEYCLFVVNSSGMPGFASNHVWIGSQDFSSIIFSQLQVINELTEKYRNNSKPKDEIFTEFEAKLVVITDNLDKYDDFLVAKNILEKVIGASKEIINSKDVPESAKTALKRAIETVMKKNSFSKLDKDENGNASPGQEIDGKVKYIVNDKKIVEIISKIDSIKNQSTSIDAMLGGTDKSISGVKTIRLEVDLAVQKDKTIEVQVPNKIVQAAIEKGIDKIVVKTAMAEIEADATVFNRDNKNISLSTKKLSDAKYSGNAYDFLMNENDKNIAAFDSDLSITIPYTLKAEERPEDMTVFYIDSKGEKKNIAGFYDSKSKSIKFRTNHFSIYLVIANRVKFTDMKQNWAVAYVESLASKGIITGMGNGEMRVTSQVTRAEFVTMICNAMKIVPITSNSLFKDVSQNDWFSPFIQAGYKNGILSGYSDGTFKPQNPVSREEMAAIISKILVKYLKKDMLVKSDIASTKFTDSANINSYAVDAVSTAYKYGIIKGNNNKFLPKDKVTRAEAAVVIYKLLTMLY